MRAGQTGGARLDNVYFASRPAIWFRIACGRFEPRTVPFVRWPFFSPISRIGTVGELAFIATTNCARSSAGRQSQMTTMSAAQPRPLRFRSASDTLETEVTAYPALLKIWLLVEEKQQSGMTDRTWCGGCKVHLTDSVDSRQIYYRAPVTSGTTECDVHRGPQG